MGAQLGCRRKMKTSDYTDVELTLKQGGRTFHWARRFLGDPAGSNAARLYAMCRMLDDMADGDIEDGPARLYAIRQQLEEAAPADPALVAFHPFMQETGIPAEAVIALMDGLIQDQDDVRINDEAALKQYCYRVAGTVGLMMCPILGTHQQVAFAHAIDLGIAMQMTNITRDILEDARMLRRYLPADWVDGMDPAEMVVAVETGDPVAIRIVAAAAQRLVGMAEDYYRSGIKGLNYLPLRSHLAILIAARAYRQIGLQLVRQGCPWHQGRQVTSTATKARVSIAALPLMLRRLQSPTVHLRQLHAGLEGLPHVHE